MIQRKHIIIVLIAFSVLCMFYFLLAIYPRLNKIPVEVLVHPNDATLSVDGKGFSPGTIYLHPGAHSFKAEKEGWKTDEVSVTISNDLTSIALLPIPESEEAREQARRESRVREGLSSIAANMRGLDIRNSYPILSKLPYSDISGPFKIDYGFNQDDKKTPYLIISFSTPNGRREAIQWLKENDTDITKVEIIFEDFENAAYKEEDTHEH